MLLLEDFCYDVFCKHPSGLLCVLSQKSQRSHCDGMKLKVLCSPQVIEMLLQHPISPAASICALQQDVSVPAATPELNQLPQQAEHLSENSAVSQHEAIIRKV